MRFKFSLKTSELVNLYVFSSWSSPWRARTRQRLRFMLSGGMGLLGLSFLLRGGTDSYIAGTLLVMMAVLWLFFYENIYIARLRRFAKGYYNHEVNERFWKEKEYEFSTECIRLRSEYIDATLQWKSIINVIEREDAFWLFETLSTAHILPKRVMSEMEQKTFRKMVADRMVVV